MKKTCLYLAAEKPLELCTHFHSFLEAGLELFGSGQMTVSDLIHHHHHFQRRTHRHRHHRRRQSLCHTHRRLKDREGRE